mgnify:CR=1 FL=1
MQYSGFAKATPRLGKAGRKPHRMRGKRYEQDHHPGKLQTRAEPVRHAARIGTVKRLFADTLCATLNLYRVSAPLFLEASTGLNDDLNGVERKVTFDIKDSGTEAQVVQSLAKWSVRR